MAMTALGRPAWTDVVHGGFSATEAVAVEFQETKSTTSVTLLPFLETKDKDVNIDFIHP